MDIASKQLAGGALIFVIGAGAAIIGLSSYRMGTLAMPGPGLFPVALGFILAALGAGIVVQGLGRKGERMSFDWQTTVAILSAVIAFALVVRPFGLVPAVFATVLIARLAEPLRFNIRLSLTLAAAAAASAWLIFVVLLHSPVAAFRWPF